MRTAAIICIECSIRVYYDDCSIRVSRSFKNLSHTKSVVLSRAGAYGDMVLDHFSATEVHAV